MIRIAIDGPGGAGKSSVAKAIAKELGIIYVDTGALYRSIALHMLTNNISKDDEDAVVAELTHLTLSLQFLDGKQVIILDGEDVGDRIRTPEISMAASKISSYQAVRDYLLNTQRNIAKENSVIMDGRDIGTVILPYAEVKIFLTASAEARAKRRYIELSEKGHSVSYEQVYNEMVERDKNDSTRAIAPCVPAEDAILLDNSNLNFEQTCKKIIKIIKKKCKKTFYMKAHRILAPVIRFFQRIKPVGLENVPLDKPYIICSNHIAAKDVIMIAAAYPRQIYFVAKKELFSIPVLGFLIKKLGAIKLDRGGSDVSAIKTSVNAAKSGKNIAIFPQGHRYPGVNPETTPKKNGAALIAFKSENDILPVCIKTKNNKYGFFKKIEIVFGKPIENSSLGFTSGGSEEYRAATDKIFSEVIKLGDFSSLPSFDDIKETKN